MSFFASLNGEEITLKCKNWDANYYAAGVDYDLTSYSGESYFDEHYTVRCEDGYSVIDKSFFLHSDELSNKWKEILKEADRYPDEHEYPLYITGKLTRVDNILSRSCNVHLDYERKKYGDGHSRDIVTLSK